MKSSTRKFDINGEEYQFNKEALRTRIDAIVKDEGVTRESIYERISDELGDVTPEAAKSWVYRSNGPGTIDRIKGSADALGIKDYMFLLKKVEGEKKMRQLSDRQIDAAKRIYDKFTWFLEEFNNTDGFTNWWYDYHFAGHRDPSDAAYDRIQKMIKEIGLVISQEYFDLHDHEIYDDYNEYFNEDLYKTFNGKVDSSYRYDAMHEDCSNTSTWEDYEIARQRLNEIIERYI